MLVFNDSSSSNNTNKFNPQEPVIMPLSANVGSNNTNKFNPQERDVLKDFSFYSSNNTNKFNPQEPTSPPSSSAISSNNTNKFNPQELELTIEEQEMVQIIQINSILKNHTLHKTMHSEVQIIQINSILKNCRPYYSIIVLYLQYILSICIIKS